MSQDIHTTPVGLIGIGLLGSSIAERLLRAGYSVVGFDIDPQRRAVMEALGGKTCRLAGEVFPSCQVVFFSLPTSEIVAALLERERTHMPSRRTIIDTTTGDPEQMMEHHAALSHRGIDYVEATVAGSSQQLRTGTAVLFVGGEDSAKARVRPLLDALAEKHFDLGSIGSASRFKLVHNLLLGLHRAVLAEGLTFAEAIGFDAGQVLDILRNTPAASAVMETKGQKMVARDRAPQARLSQHRKDVRLILELARKHAAHVPLSETHEQILAAAEVLGFGDADNSAVIEAFRKASP